MTDLEDKVAIITGAAGNLGAAVANTFSARPTPRVGGKT
jgi:NAD(P)-dependent dehydrogenase (short-subunit alcohol dehydrogenase family)